MNITGMAFPFAAYFDPMVYGGATGADFGAWVFAHLFFDMKMMGIFSMLFGAGVILMFQRAEAAGRGFAAVHYRRTFWLLVIGLVHAYLVWYGDILVTYALCGFLLFLFWRVLSLMLIGMGMMKAGVLTARRPEAFYRRCMAWGFGLGLPLVAIGIREWSRLDYDFIARFLYTSHFNHFGSVLVSLGFVGLVMWTCRAWHRAA